uniref:ASCH domain-containing protein n=1 Tax=Thaumasiovibrio occultus TaxID=1891184 RepID=UPI000B3566C5|nr:ASCH domain-containing protein [Thaumasiovibrio occultus]
MNQRQQFFVDRYLIQLSDAERKAVPKISAEYFYADDFNTNECARLVDAGVKTASSHLKAVYDKNATPLPVEGELVIILNWFKEPVCVVKVTDVASATFAEVSEEFAQAEGEGNGNYQWWHDAHAHFFAEQAKECGVGFDPSSPLILKRFEKVFPFPA